MDSPTIQFEVNLMILPGPLSKFLDTRHSGQRDKWEEVHKGEKELKKEEKELEWQATQASIDGNRWRF